MPLQTAYWSESSWGAEFGPASETCCDDTWGTFLSSSDQYKLTVPDTMETYPFSSIIPTAALKQSTISSDFSDSCEKEWIRKPVKQWTPKDVLNWAVSVIEQSSPYEELRLLNFRVDGITLRSWGENDFVDKDPVFGSTLYIALQALLLNEENKSAYNRLFDDKPDASYLPPFPTIKSSVDRLSPSLGDSGSASFTELTVSRDYLQHDSGSEHSDGFSSFKSEGSIRDQNQVKKKRGRPVGNRSKRKSEKKCGRLWEFIRDLLLNAEYCPSLICWENHDEGVFRFVRSDKVAELWGTIKDNPKMTYEKLSRAMRYYYKSKVLQPVFGRRLVYKFGPTARGWRTNNPNFRQPIPCE